MNIQICCQAVCCIKCRCVGDLPKRLHTVVTSWRWFQNCCHGEYDVFPAWVCPEANIKTDNSCWLLTVLLSRGPGRPKVSDALSQNSPLRRPWNSRLLLLSQEQLPWWMPPHQQLNIRSRQSSIVLLTCLLYHTTLGSVFLCFEVRGVCSASAEPKQLWKAPAYPSVCVFDWCPGCRSTEEYNNHVVT